jgi:hypothetical protein
MLLTMLKDQILTKIRVTRQCIVRPGLDLLSVPIPDAVQTMVLSKVEGLTLSQQLLVRLGAAFGTRFPILAIHSILSEGNPTDLMVLDKRQISEDLVRLEAFNITRRVDPRISSNHIRLSETVRIH